MHLSSILWVLRNASIEVGISHYGSSRCSRHLGIELHLYWETIGLLGAHHHPHGHWHGDSSVDSRITLSIRMELMLPLLRLSLLLRLLLRRLLGWWRSLRW